VSAVDLGELVGMVVRARRLSGPENSCQLEAPLRNKVRHPSVPVGSNDRRGASSWRSEFTARGVKKMSTIEPSGAAGASAAADAVGAQFTAPHDPHYEPPATT
jgi:hypothetical protein